MCDGDPRMFLYIDIDIKWYAKALEACDLMQYMHVDKCKCRS